MTSRDAADLSGISTSIVSFVLNNGSNVKISEDSRRRALNFARALDSGKTQHMTILPGKGREHGRVKTVRPFFGLGITAVVHLRGYPVVPHALDEPSNSKDYTNPGQTFPGRGNA